MTTYRYVKAPAGYTLHRPTPGRDRARLFFSSLLLTLGVTAFTSVLYPLLSYQQSYAPRFNRPELVTPGVQPVLAADTKPTFVPEMVNTTLDYTNSSTWFASGRAVTTFDPIIYHLTIPKLGINQAVVRNDHTDLKESLIHYPGTAMPGDLGNPVIFGHSVLPQFFNPKNYLSIFSTLHTLVPGDEIILTSAEATYTYKIRDMYQTEPDDLSPLAQSYGDRYLTLITCTPPGTYLKRLIIKAVLI